MSKRATYLKNFCRKKRGNLSTVLIFFDLQKVRQDDFLVIWHLHVY